MTVVHANSSPSKIEGAGGSMTVPPMFPPRLHCRSVDILPLTPSNLANLVGELSLLFPKLELTYTTQVSPSRFCLLETGCSPRSHHRWGFIDWQGDTLPRYYYYERDHQGSVRTIRDESFNVKQSVSYTLSGVPVLGVVSSIGGRHRHTGKPWHNLGGLAWYDNRARWYDPVTMRFLAPDPLADQDPENSPWAWCRNNPLRYADPTGMTFIMENGLSQQSMESLQNAIEAARESILFKTYYDALENSSKIYTLNIGETSITFAKDHDSGNFDPIKNVITILKSAVNVQTIAEEIYHAYQSANVSATSEKYNMEYEAKVVSVAVALDAGRPYYFMGLKEMSDNIASGKYYQGESFLSPNDMSSFEQDYVKNGASYIKAFDSKVLPSYCIPIFRLPDLLRDLLTKISK